MSSKIKIVTTWIAGGAVVLLACGCSQTPINHGESFNPPLQAQQIQAIAHAQAAAGAREDGTLYPQHFDGPALSSLGTNALDLELADSHNCNPLVVYLAVPNDTFSADRRTAVGRYLADKGGLKPEQIQFVDGPNPATNYPVEDNLTNYARTDSSTADSGGGSSSGGSSSSASGSSSSSTGH